jgi:signal recognition particle receptor subunit beta
VTLTDIPGHDFSLDQVLAAYRSCKGVVFMIDSFDKNSFKSCAESLYELLATHMRGNILVFCNKQDIPFAKKPMIIESELSTEM